MEQIGTFVVHHWALFAALALILVLLAFVSLGPVLQGVKQVDPTEAIRLLNHDGGVILDVREDSEYQEGHILNAVHVPLGRLKDQLQRLEKYKQRPVIMVCRSGQRSADATGLLLKSGFATIYNLKGGLLAWKNANLPLTRR